MDLRHKQKIIYRLLSGHVQCLINDCIYYIEYPSYDLLSKSEAIYDKVLKENRFNNWLHKTQLLPILIGYGVWHFGDDDKLKKNEKDIETLKYELYKTHVAVADEKPLRKILKNTRLQYNALLNKKHCLDVITLEEYAARVSHEYIFSNIILDSQFKKIENLDYSIFEAILNKFLKMQASIDELRELSHTEPWRALWSTHNTNLFSIGKPLTDEQHTLILYSQMYDNVYEHPDCPADDILNDDDLLDGWMIMQRKQKEEELKEKSINKSDLSKHGDAQELFIMAKSKEDVERINLLNNPIALAAKRSRQKIINEKGEASDLDFPDVVQDVRMKAQQDQIQRIKSLKNKG